jgi:hypothetical protein
MSRKRKRFNKRYLSRQLWDMLCRAFPSLRKKLHFYRSTIGTDSIGVAPVLAQETEHDLSARNVAFTKEEKAFILHAWEPENTYCTDRVVRKKRFFLLEDALLCGHIGSVVYRGHVLSSEPGVRPLDNPNYSKPLPGAHEHTLDARTLYFSMTGVPKGHKQFYHFFIDFLPQLYYVLEAFPRKRMTVVTNDDLCAYQTYAYDYAKKRHPHLEFMTIGERDVFRIPNLLYAESGQNAHSSFLDPGYVRFLHAVFLEGQHVVPSARPSRRIYVTRDDAKNRRVSNEAELLPILRRYGYDVIRPTELSHKEQIALFANAESIVGPAGAAFANLIYARPGTHVAIFYPENLIGDQYVWLAKATGLKPAHLAAGPTEGRRGHFRIPPELLERELRRRETDL